MSWRRALLSILGVLWLLWFALVTYVNVSEIGSFFGPSPVEAYDLPDLLFWGALMIATYAMPLVLALCWVLVFKNKRKSAA
jgi:hypothetical protein